MSRLDELAEKARLDWLSQGKPIPTSHDIAAAMENMGKFLVETGRRAVLMPESITVTEIIPRHSIVHWIGDPRYKMIADSTLEELPEFLISDDEVIRGLAALRVKFLKANLSIEEFITRKLELEWPREYE